MTKTKLTNDQLADITPWEIATHYGIGYNGDMNPLEHGGYFYSVNDWENYGYASTVEFWEHPETGHLIVQPGTIHKFDGERLDDAFRYICIEEGSPDRNNLHAQVEACQSWAGIEPDGTAYPDLKVFNPETWKERNVWKSIRDWVERLAD